MSLKFVTANLLVAQLRRVAGDRARPGRRLGAGPDSPALSLTAEAWKPHRRGLNRRSLYLGKRFRQGRKLGRLNCGNWHVRW